MRRERVLLVVLEHLLYCQTMWSSQTDAKRLKSILRSEDVQPGRDTVLNPLSPVEVAKQYGYKAETHTVTTSDGYILTMHRIQNGSVHVTEPFFLQHGLALNSGQWMVQETSQNLVFMLADNGFDIWLTNIRGNMYSRKNERMSSESREFWNYGWHEHGIIDVPTMIDYVLIQTGYKQIYYVGHSMGTTMFFVMGSMRPDYNAKIKHMFALAPVAHMGNLKSPLREFAPDIRSHREILKVLNNHVPSELIAFQLGKIGVCAMTKALCGRVLDFLGGVNPKSDETVQEVLFRYFPDVVSADQLNHYAQLINNPYSFRLLDHYEMNMVRYGYFVPPEYPVHKISAPMTFFYSSNDYFVAVKDVETFSSKLRNVRMILVQDTNFNHFDYIIALHAKDTVYVPLLQIANSYRAQYASGTLPNIVNTQFKI